MKGEFPTSVLATLIGVEDPDSCTKLCATVCLVFPVRSQGITFLLQEVKGGKLCFVVCEGDIVTVASECCNRGRSPQVQVDFLTKGRCVLPLVSLCNGLMGGLCIDA